MLIDIRATTEAVKVGESFQRAKKICASFSFLRERHSPQNPGPLPHLVGQKWVSTFWCELFIEILWWLVLDFAFNPKAVLGDFVFFSLCRTHFKNNTYWKLRIAQNTLKYLLNLFVVIIQSILHIQGSWSLQKLNSFALPYVFFSFSSEDTDIGSNQRNTFFANYFCI